MHKEKDGTVVASLTEVKNKTGDIFALVDEYGEVTLTSYNKPRYKISKLDISDTLSIKEKDTKEKEKKEPKKTTKAEKKEEPAEEKVEEEKPEPPAEPKEEDESGIGAVFNPGATPDPAVPIVDVSNKEESSEEKSEQEVEIEEPDMPPQISTELEPPTSADSLSKLKGWDRTNRSEKGFVKQAQKPLQ